MLYELKTGTLTRAQRCVNILKKQGIKAYIGRLKNPKKEDGCGYTVRVNTDNIYAIITLLKRNGVEISGVDSA